MTYKFHTPLKKETGLQKFSHVFKPEI